MNFGFIFIYVHFLKAFCYIEAIKSCLLPFLSNLYCTSVKRPTSIKRPLFKSGEWPLNRGRTAQGTRDDMDREKNVYCSS